MSELFKELPDGWIICPAMLILSSGKDGGPTWRARALNEDGRTLVAEVAGESGPMVAERVAAAMIPRDAEIFHPRARRGRIR